MTRWAKDDIASHLMDIGFHTIHMPAAGYWLDDRDAPLWRERWTSGYLADMRRELGDAVYELMFQGTPQALEGGRIYPMFSTRTHVAVPPRRGQIEATEEPPPLDPVAAMLARLVTVAQPSKASAKPGGEYAFKQVIGGLDFAVMGVTAAVMLGKDVQGRWWLFKEFYQARASEGDFLTWLMEQQGRYHVQTWYCDPSGAMMIEHMQGLGLRVQKANNDWAAGVRTVARLLEVSATGRPGLMFSPECIHSISEAMSYYTRPLAGGLGFAENVPPQPDHAMDALRYALHTAQVVERPVLKSRPYIVTAG